MNTYQYKIKLSGKPAQTGTMQAASPWAVMRHACQFADTFGQKATDVTVQKIS
jgi:hypothetical protein